MDASKTASDHHNLVLAVDGGGSKTEVLLAAVTGPHAATTLGRGRAGSSNPTASGAQQAQANIGKAIALAFADADLPATRVTAACLALAGVGRPVVRQEMVRWASSAALARQVQVVHDAQAVLVAATARGVGVAVVCGTGSFAYGRSPRGEQARSGGWGYLLGDEGSGFAIANAALRAIVRAADGRGPGTSMTESMLQQLQVGHPARLPEFVYRDASVRRTIAALAPLVFTAAENGDEVATQICSEAASELALLVSSVARRLQFADGQFELALAGGVLTRQEELRHSLSRALVSLNCNPRHTFLVPEPVTGALKIALGMCSETT